MSPEVPGVPNSAAVILDGQTLTCGQVAAVARGVVLVEVSPDGRERAAAAAATAAAVSGRRPVYGRTTGVGANRDQTVRGGDAATSGLRLLRSHAGGGGPLIAAELSRAMLVVRPTRLRQAGPASIQGCSTCWLTRLTAGWRCPFPLTAPSAPET